MKYCLAILFMVAGLSSVWAWNDDLFNRLPDDAVLVDADRVLLLKRDVLREEALWKKLYGNVSGPEAQIGKRPEIVSRFERETVLAQETIREKVFVSDLEVSGKIIEIARKSGDKKAKYASVFIRRLGEDGTLLENLVRRQVHVAALERTVRDAVPAITDAEVMKEKEKRVADNERAKGLLVHSWDSVSNLWNRISAKGDFDTCVAEYEEERDHIQGDPEWGDFTIGFFDDNPHLQKLLRTARSGQIFPPMEANNGLMIIKVVGIDYDAEAASSKEAKRYKLASLFVAVPYFHPDLTDEQLRAEILKERQDKAWEKKIAEVKAAATIKYPSGREVFDTRTPFRSRLRCLAK